MGFINIKLKGKYTIKCLKFLVFYLIYPLIGLSVTFFLLKNEELMELFKIINS